MKRRRRAPLTGGTVTAAAEGRGCAVTMALLAPGKSSNAEARAAEGGVKGAKPRQAAVAAAAAAAGGWEGVTNQGALFQQLFELPGS
jgi:hypothetical protein